LLSFTGHEARSESDFFDEMDALLRCFLEDGISLVILGDFNIQPEKLHSSEFIYIFLPHSA